MPDLPSRPAISTSAWSPRPESPHTETPSSATTPLLCAAGSVKETQEYKNLSQLYTAYRLTQTTQEPTAPFEIFKMHEGRIHISASDGYPSPFTVGPNHRLGLFDRELGIAATTLAEGLVILNSPENGSTKIIELKFYEGGVETRSLWGNPIDYHREDDENWSMTAKWTGTILPSCPEGKSCASCCAVEDLGGSERENKDQVWEERPWQAPSFLPTYRRHNSEYTTL